MPMDWQAVAFPFLGGVDKKVSGHILQPPRLQLCTNAYSDKTGRLRKREGSDDLSMFEMDSTALPTIVALANAPNDRMLAFSADKAFEFSDAGQRWIDKGMVAPARVTQQSIGKATTGNIVQMDCATVNGYTMYLVSETTSGGSALIQLSVFDDNGSVIVSNQQLTSSGSAPRCVAHSGKLYGFFYDATGTPAIKVIVVDPTSGSTVISSATGTPVSIATSDVQIVSGRPVMDACASSPTNGVFFAYRTNAAAPGAIKRCFVSSTGTLTAAATEATTAVAIGLAVAAHATGAMHNVSYYTGTTPNDLYSWLRSWNGSAWSSTSTSAAIVGLLNQPIINVVAIFDSATVVRQWVSGDTATTSHTDDNTRTFQCTHDTSGTTTQRVFTVRHACIASKPFQDNGKNFIVLGFGDYSTSIQSSLFLWNATDNYVVADVLRDVAVFSSSSASPNTRMHSSVSAASSGASTYRICSVYKTTIPVGDVTVSIGGFGAMCIDLALSHDASNKVVESNGCAYMAGGYLQVYDGVNWCESNFLRFVESSKVNIAPSAGAGALTASTTYFYRIIPVQFNALGQRELGTDSGSIQRTMGVGENTNTISLSTIIATRREGSGGRHIGFSIWRTKAGAGANAPFYYVDTVDNTISADQVQYIDLIGDSVIEVREQLPYASGELDGVAPPSGHIICTGAGRMFMAGFRDSSEVLASKLMGAGDPVAFNDALQIQIPAYGGAITALAFMNEMLVVFKERAVYRIRPTGVNNLGEGSFGDPELVSTDVGCNNQRGVGLTPMGLFFTNPRGIYLLDQGFGVNFIGAPVEDYVHSDSVPLSVTVVPLKNQIRVNFGRDMVFDYFHKQWYLFDYAVDCQGPSIYWNDSYVYTTGGQIRQEPMTAGYKFTDGNSTYTTTARLAWLRAPETLQGELRVRYVGFLGQTDTGGGDLRMFVYEDYEEVSFSQQETETSLPLGIIERQWRLDNQRVSAVMVELDDNSSNADLKLSEVAFEVGIKPDFKRY